MAEKLIKVDKNGTKYYVDSACPRCGGTGRIPGYDFIEGGICFKCGGTGWFEHWRKEYDPAYAQKLADRRLAKARKTAPERNRKFMLAEGFSEDGFAWVVTGNTYEIKDQLKEAGAKWNPTLGWHFDHETEFPSFRVSFEELTKEWADGGRSYKDGTPDEIQKKKDEIRLADCRSDYIGTVGEKIEIEVTYKGFSTYETHMTYRGETHIIHRFEDAEGNKVIWNTTSWGDFEEGKSYKLRATVKEHSEYRGERQTVLTRAKSA